MFVCLFDYFVLFLVFLLLFICLFWPGLDGKNPWIKIMHLQTMTEGHEEINFGLDWKFLLGWVTFTLSMKEHKGFWWTFTNITAYLLTVHVKLKYLHNRHAFPLCEIVVQISRIKPTLFQSDLMWTQSEGV